MRANSICRTSILLGLVGLLGSVFASSATAAPDGRVPGHYIVVLEDSVQHPAAVAENQVSRRGGEVGFVYRTAIKGYSAELSKADVEALRNNPDVAYIESDVRGGVTSQIKPTGTRRVFADSNDSLDVDEVDDRRVDVDIAVIDSGIDDEHPDLDVVSEIDCSTGTCEAGGNDDVGHGTHVAGIAGAIDNGEGVVGVAPGARLWSVRVIDGEGNSVLSEYIAGLDWVTSKAAQIEVANSSLRYFTHTSSKAFEESLDASLKAGIVHVAGAGNEEESVKFVPGNHPDMITVSALSDLDGLPGKLGGPGDDALGFRSNFGSVVDVIAPGIGILSTMPGNEYASDSGTSMASPHVAAAAAVLASQDNPENKADVEAIRNTIVAKGNSNWTDTSGDGVKEPLLDLSDESVFWVPGPPVALSKAATSVVNHSATLRGDILTNASSTSYQFEYGPTTEYGTSFPVPAKNVAGGGWKSVSAEIEGLEPGATYHYRLVATNEDGTAYGEDMTFTTSSWGFTQGQYSEIVAGDAPYPTSGEMWIGSGYGCPTGPFLAELPEASTTLTTYQTEGGLCTLSGSDPMDMGECQLTFTVEEGWSYGGRGTLDFGPEECGPITFELHPYPCEILLDPHNNLYSFVEYEDAEGGGVNADLTLEFDFTSPGCGVTKPGRAAWYARWFLTNNANDLEIGET